MQKKSQKNEEKEESCYPLHWNEQCEVTKLKNTCTVTHFKEMIKSKNIDDVWIEKEFDNIYPYLLAIPSKIPQYYIDWYNIKGRKEENCIIVKNLDYEVDDESLYILFSQSTLKNPQNIINCTSWKCNKSAAPSGQRWDVIGK